MVIRKTVNKHIKERLVKFWTEKLKWPNDTSKINARKRTLEMEGPWQEFISHFVSYLQGTIIYKHVYFFDWLLKSKTTEFDSNKIYFTLNLNFTHNLTFDKQMLYILSFLLKVMWKYNMPLKRPCFLRVPSACLFSKGVS